MNRQYKIEAVVINSKNIGEGDRLVTLLSKDRGKIKVIAKGVRKIASRRGPNLDLFNHVLSSMYKGKGIDTVTEVRSVNNFKGIKRDLSKIGSAYLVLELVNELLVEDQGGSGIFDLLLQTLNLLDDEKNNKDISKITRGFEIKLLFLLGFRPQLDFCSHCEKPLSFDDHYIAPEAGGLVSKDCLRISLTSKKISSNSIKILRFYQKNNWTDILKLKFNKELEEEIGVILSFYMNFVTEKNLSSEQFLNRISK